MKTICEFAQILSQDMEKIFRAGLTHNPGLAHVKCVDILSIVESIDILIAGLKKLKLDLLKEREL